MVSFILGIKIKSTRSNSNYFDCLQKLDIFMSKIFSLLACFELGLLVYCIATITCKG